jgi:NAD(P)-dependent dehydrogenase (short-subunit alcohol dehydrogenase family)
MNLSNRTAVVTGASKGTGAAITGADFTIDAGTVPTI